MKRSKLKHLLINSPVLIFFSIVFIAIAISSTMTASQELGFCNQSGTCSSSGIKLTGAVPSSGGVPASSVPGCAPGTDNNCCGSGADAVQTSIDFGCFGDRCTRTATANSPYCNGPHNSITDLLFAIIRFLSDGVGIVVVASVVIGGVQYIVSRGDPNTTQGAIRRLTSAATALFVYIFAWSFLNFIVPDFFVK